VLQHQLERRPLDRCRGDPTIPPEPLLRQQLHENSEPSGVAFGESEQLSAVVAVHGMRWRASPQAVIQQRGHRRPGQGRDGDLHVCQVQRPRGGMVSSILDVGREHHTEARTSQRSQEPLHGRSGRGDVIEQQRTGLPFDREPQGAPQAALCKRRGVRAGVGRGERGRDISEAAGVGREPARAAVVAEANGEFSKDAGLPDAQRPQQEQGAPMQDSLLDFIEELFPAGQAVHA